MFQKIIIKAPHSKILWTFFYLRLAFGGRIIYLGKSTTCSRLRHKIHYSERTEINNNFLPSVHSCQVNNFVI